MREPGVSQREAIKLLRKARKVFAFVRHMSEDGQYIAISKTEAIRAIAECPFADGSDRAEYLVKLEDNGNAYIN